MIKYGLNDNFSVLLKTRLVLSLFRDMSQFEGFQIFYQETSIACFHRNSLKVIRIFLFQTLD